MLTKDKPVIEKVKPIINTAGAGAEEVFSRVLAIARGITYQPHPKRAKLMTVIKFAGPLMLLGVLVGRKSSQN